MKRFTKLVLTALFIFPLVTLAQDASTDPVGLLTAGTKTLAESAQNKNWALFIPTLVVLVVTVFRYVASKFAVEGTKFRTFVDNRWTKWGLNFVTTFCGALVGAATLKTQFSVNLVVNSLLMSFTAAGGIEFFNDVVKAFVAKPAVTAGTNAAKNPGPTLNG